MEFIEIPETVRVGGKEAIKSLNDYISELEQHETNELTPKQKSTMIKFARCLMASIEDEMQREGVPKQTESSNIMERIRRLF
jgi:predicted DNA binding CopG/RHH family protein